MAEILSFIEKCETDGIDVFLQDAAGWPDIEKSRQFLLTINKAERAKAEASLIRILKELTEQEQQIRERQKSIRDGMKQAAESQKVCLAYLESIGKGQKQRSAR